MIFHLQRAGTVGSKIEELSSSKSQVNYNADSQKSSAKVLASSEPDFSIFKKPIDSENPDCLVANINLPGVLSKQDIMLDIGEDRLVCEANSNNHQYIMDIFLPYKLDQEECKAEFCRDKHLLSVDILIVS